MIPHTLYTYFGGRLSWLRYMTVVSFKKYNPDWDIKVYYPKELTTNVTWNTGEQGDEYDGHNWFEDLAEYAELVEFDMESIEMSNELPEVHKSGLFRAWALSTMGGVYCDMDILFFKPLVIPDGIDTIQCYNPNGGYFSDGFIGCGKDNVQFKKLFELTKTNLGTGYQSAGLNIWNAIMPRESLPSNVWNIPMSMLYQYDSTHIEQMFSNNEPMFNVNAIGVHWYGGSPITRKWEQLMLPDKYNYNIMISKVIREVVNHG